VGGHVARRMTEITALVLWSRLTGHLTTLVLLLHPDKHLFEWKELTYCLNKRQDVKIKSIGARPYHARIEKPSSTHVFHNSAFCPQSVCLFVVFV
jgi:hypothetical protein